MASQDNPKICWDSKNLAEEWKKFEEHAELMFIGPLKRASSQEQAAYIRLWLGEKGREIFRSWNLSNDDAKNPDLIIKAFREYCAPKKNTVFARYLFQERKQKEEEAFESFVTDLRNLVKECEYMEPENMVRDKIVGGIKSKEIRQLLLTEGDNLTMSKAIEISTSYEITQKCLNEMTPQVEATANIDEIKKRQQYRNPPKVSQRMIRNCKYCGLNHAVRNCPAYGQICNFCQGQNHFAKTCPRKRRNARVNAIEEDDEYASENQVHSIGKNERYDTQDEMYIFTLEDEKCEIDDVKNYDDDNDDDDENNDGYIFSLEGSQPDTVFATLDINKNEKLKFKIDTGAQVNVIPAVIFDKLNNPPELCKSRHKLVSYTGQHLTVNGSVKLQCGYRDKIIYAEFIIAEGCQTQPILSLKTSLELNLIKLTLSVEKPNVPLT